MCLPNVFYVPQPALTKEVWFNYIKLNLTYWS